MTFLAALILASGAWAQDKTAALMSAAYNGPLSDVKAALKSGADVNALDEDGENALMYAVSGGHDDIAAYLLAHGADVDRRSARGDTALSYAALKERPAAARLLIDKGADVNAKNLNDATPLVIAASHGSAKTAAVLAGKGADLNARSADGTPALMTAILDGQDEVARLLIEKGAGVNARDNNGSTPLIAAAFKGRSGVAQLLIDKGADVKAADAHSESAAEYAKASGHDDIAAMIEAALGPENAERERRERERARREEEARKAEEAKAAALAEQRKREEARLLKLWLLAGGALISIIVGIAFTVSQRRQAAAKERQRQKQMAAADIRDLAARDPDRGYRALAEYEKQYHDTSVFAPDVLLRLYEARDRARQATPEKVRRRAEAQSREQAIANVRRLIKDDPREAYDALKDFVSRHGDSAPFTGAELGNLFETAGREGELLSGALKLSDAQAVELAAFLSQRDRHEAAIRLISEEPLLSGVLRLDGGCDEVIRIYDRAGALPAFFDLCKVKSHEFQTSYARSFLAMGRPGDCLKTMNLVRIKDRDDQAVIAAALVAEGRKDEALKTIEDVSKAAWSFVGWSAFMQFCLKTARWEEAREALDHLVLLRPLRRDPKLHYDLGLACEAAGRADMAGEIFHAFVKAELPYKDAQLRAARLPKPPETVRKPMEPGPAEASQTRVGGRYDLRSTLGRGDLGVVFSAYDSKAGRKAAIKQLRPEIAHDEKERTRYLHQAKLAARVEHPAIIGVREIIDEGGEIYLVFDYAEGETLAKKLAQTKRLDLALCRTVLEPVCQALDHGHLRNVLHLALTPANIMVHDMRGKLMDFGLARAGRLPHDYSAPEAHEGKFTRACDVYSLGVLLFQMTAGRLPFSGADILAQKKARKLPSLHSLVAQLPRELDALIGAALDPDPKERLPDAVEFFAELKRLSVETR